MHVIMHIYGPMDIVDLYVVNAGSAETICFFYRKAQISTIRSLNYWMISTS